MWFQTDALYLMCNKFSLSSHTCFTFHKQTSWDSFALVSEGHGAAIPDIGPVQKYFLNSSKIHSRNSDELGSNCPRHWCPAVFSGKISPKNPTVLVAENLACPSSDAYFLTEDSRSLPRAAPADTHLKELESLDIILPLWSYLLVAIGWGKRAVISGRAGQQKLNLGIIVKVWPLWNPVPSTAHWDNPLCAISIKETATLHISERLPLFSLFP